MTQGITPASTVNAILTFINLSANEGQTRANIPQGTSGLLALADGTELVGFVVTRDSASNPVIRTPLGDFSVRSELFIKTGSDVVLKVNSAAPSFAEIVTIDQLPPTEYALQNGRILNPDSVQPSRLAQVATTTALTLSPEKPAALPVIRGLVLQSPAGAPGALPGAILVTGTPITLTVHDVVLPPIPAQLAATPRPANLAQLLPAAPTASNPTATTVPTSLPPQTTSSLAAPLATAFVAFEKSLAAVPLEKQNPLAQKLPAAQNFTPQLPGNNSPQQAPTNQPAANDAGAPLIQGTIIGYGEDGSSIIQAEGASFKMFAEQVLPTGTTLLFSVSRGNPPAPIAVAPPPMHTKTGDKSAAAPINFTFYTQAMTALAASDPAIAREVSKHMPVIGDRFASGLLYFLSSVKSGERRGLFSRDEIARLEAVVPGFLSQLNREMRELHQQFQASPPHEWKTIPLPLIFNSEAQPAQLYVRQDPPDSQGVTSVAGAGKRFILDLHLSVLGDMQLDGFVRKAETGTHLELFFRSAAVLEPTIMEDIRTRFIAAIGPAGMRGNIIFQQGAEMFARPTNAPPPPHNAPPPHTILA